MTQSIGQDQKIRAKLSLPEEKSPLPAVITIFSYVKTYVYIFFESIFVIAEF